MRLPRNGDSGSCKYKGCRSPAPRVNVPFPPMLDHSKVAIFWDYENCSPSSNAPGLGYDIVNNLGRMARVFGCVSTFKAYLDISAQSPKSVPLRSELQSSGVSMIDCPHNGKKEVVDKMILVDLLAFAVDNPPPATVILITGDRDYAYAMATLRLRKYKVVLIVPQSPHVHVCLESQASVLIDWTSVVLRTRMEATNSFMRQPYQDLGPQLVAELAKAVAELHDDSDTTVCSAFTGFSSQQRQISAHDLLRPSTFANGIGTDSLHCPLGVSHPRLSQEMSQKDVSVGDETAVPELSVPKTPTHSLQGSLSTPPPLPPRSSTVSTQGAVETEKEPVMRSAGSSSRPTGRRSSAPGMADITCPPPSSGLAPPDPYLELPVQYDGPPSSIIIGSPLEPLPNNGEYGRQYVSQLDYRPDRTSSMASPSSTTRTLGRVRVSSESSSVRVDTSAAPPVTSENPTTSNHEYNPKAGANIQGQYDLPNADEAARRQTLGLDDDDSGDDQCMPCQSVPDDSIVARGDINPMRHIGDSGLSDSPSVASASTSSKLPTTQSKFPPPPGTSGGAGNPSKVPSAPTSSPQAIPPTPSSGPVPRCLQISHATSRLSVDEDIRERTRTKFQPLIHLLLLAQARGITRPLRMHVAVDLIHLDKFAYQRAGVSRFRDYSALAQEAGLIELGGREAKAWIALHPSWFWEGEQAESQSPPQSSATSSLSDTLSEANRSTTGQPVSRQDMTNSTPTMHSWPPFLVPAASNISRLKEGGKRGEGLASPVPIHFQPLVAYLVGMRRAGFGRTSRHLVETSLGPNVYSQTGVSTFGAYVDRATEAGLVQCGGSGVQAWIRLHPELAV